MKEIQFKKLEGDGELIQTLPVIPNTILPRRGDRVYINNKGYMVYSVMFDYDDHYILITCMTY